MGGGSFLHSVLMKVVWLADRLAGPARHVLPRLCTACEPGPKVRNARETRAVERQQDYVLRSVEERGVRFIQLWFTDVLGIPKAFNITPAELQTALEEGMIFDGSAIDGFSRVQESDVLARPGATTFQILPTLAVAVPVARFFSDETPPAGTA